MADDVIKSENGKEYGLDMVKDAYIRSEQGPKGFARRYELSEELITKLIASGDWEKERIKYRERMYKRFSKDRIDILEWRQSLIHQVEIFELMGVETVLNDIAEQMQSTGDLYIRDDKGDIRRDSYNNPILRKISKDVKESLKMTEGLREDNTKVLLDSLQQPSLGGQKSKAIEDGRTIDLEALASADDKPSR